MGALLALEASRFFDNLTVVDAIMALVNGLVLLIILPWILWGLWVARRYCVLIGGIGTIAAGLFIVEREARIPCLLTGSFLVVLGGAWIVLPRCFRSSDEDIAGNGR